MEYIIHACQERLWYVMEYLVPSMQDQGITNIKVKCDMHHLGCLESCMQIFQSMEGDGSAWHMQDDVIICRDFKNLTEENSSGVVCGYCWEDDEHNKTGLVLPKDMRWSFPCIHIPNYLARECANWFYDKAQYHPKYRLWIKDRKYDDAVFQEFLKVAYPNMRVLNIEKSFVDHIDFLIGGTIVNKLRTDTEIRAKWFDDLDLVEELKTKLKRRERELERTKIKQS